MANFLSLQQRVASRSRLDITQAAILTTVQNYINETQKEIWEASDWYFTLDRQIIQMNTDTTAGTISATPGSPVITGAGTAFSGSMAGFYIQTSESNDWYKIVSVQSGTQLTMDVNFVGTTNLTNGTYLIRQIFYSLGSTVDKIMTARQTISPAYLDVINYRDFDVYRPYPLATADGPRAMILYGLDSSGNLQFTPYPWPTQVENIEIRFKKKPVDLVNNTDQTLIPDKWNETVLVQGAYAKACQYQDDGSNPSMHARYVTAVQKYQADLSKMVAAEAPDAAYHPTIQNRDKVNQAIGPILPYKYGAD